MDSCSNIRDRGLYVATPMYGGQCYAGFADSLTKLALLCGSNNIKIHTDFITNCSLIPLARNVLVDRFLKTDFEHLLFWDADVSISPVDVLSLMNIQSIDECFSIIGASYPVKGIRWDVIEAAVKSGISSDQLPLYQAGFPFNSFKDVEIKTDFNLPLQVKNIATGMMMIRRDALKKYAKHYPDKKFASMPNGEKDTTAYFECGLNSENSCFYPEDYLFCDNARAAGLSIWLCPWMRLKHTGTHVFEGNMEKISELGFDANNWRVFN
jgi:hypothetical protein